MSTPAAATETTAPASDSAPVGSGKSAIILGATGAVGKHLLTDLLDSSFAQVHSFSRRASGVTHAKLQEHTIDFEKLCDDPSSEDARKLKGVNADAVFITLGTTRAQAGSAKKFERIDREYVLAGAKASQVGDKAQQLLYCSSAGTSSSSPLLYPKSKGLTEEGLAGLGYKETFIFHPGMLLNAERQETRIAEKMAEGFVKGVLARITDAAGMDVRQVAQAFIKASELGTAGLTTKGVGSAPTGKGFKKAENQNGSVTALTNAEMLRLTKSG